VNGANYYNPEYLSLNLILWVMGMKNKLTILYSYVYTFVVLKNSGFWFIISSQAQASVRRMVLKKGLALISESLIKTWLIWEVSAF